ncbi:cellulose binding domain-containing protein [Streptomyces sp. NBC_00656]|uniref:cellulose binding domain-containing protein n=1 Tax=Streptomyces sp. NBC_00656 TaxID=2903668 RepID=UPI00386EBD48
MAHRRAGDRAQGRRVQERRLPGDLQAQQLGKRFQRRRHHPQHRYHRVHGRQLRFFLSPDAQKVDFAWNAALSQAGSTVQAANTSWTESIPAGGSLNFGLNGSSTSASSAPGTFAFNDAPGTTG